MRFFTVRLMRLPIRTYKIGVSRYTNPIIGIPRYTPIIGVSRYINPLISQRNNHTKKDIKQELEKTENDQTNDLAKNTKKDTLGIFSILGDITKLENGTENKPDKINITKPINEEEQDLNQLLETINLNDTEDEYKVFEPRSHSTEQDIINQEQLLFGDILKSYQQDSTESKESYDQSIYNSLKRVYKNLNNYELEKELTDRLKIALQPTFDHYNTFETKSQLISAVNDFLNTIKLDKIESFNYKTLDQYTPMIESVSQHYSSNSPQSPLLNGLTIPIIFNEFLNISNTNFNDGQLTLTLFNYLKKDLNFYLVSCNQETYNIILKTIWIYNGKSSISQVHQVFTEMANNGFSGNLITFNILKNIIVDYYHLKMGDYKYFQTSLPLWNIDDDKKVTELSSSLSQLSSRVKRQYSFDR